MKTSKIFLLSLLIIIATISCNSESKNQSDSSNKKADKKTNQVTTIDDEKEEEPKNQLQIVYDESKESIKAYYELPHIKEFYQYYANLDYTPPPSLSYPEDLSSLSYEDLRLLRNEVFARNGYLFNDGFLRGYFNRFKWYMPIFEVDTFKVIINKEESDLINKILLEENKRKEKKTISKDNLELYNDDLIVNTKQFVRIPEEVKEDFKNQNFSIVNANRSMPFYIYDQNAYQFIPHYITTDLYLFILHKYFSRSLEKLDENYMYVQLKNILKGTLDNINGLNNSNTQIQSAIEWAQMYSALALYAIGDSLVTPPANYNSVFIEEAKNMDALSGDPIFIPNQFVSYNELQPRGHYTKSDALQKYFRGFKWISLNGIDLDDNEQLRGLIIFAHTIKNQPKLIKQYKEYVSIIEKLAGQEDNLSLTDVINSVSEKDLEKALSDINLSKVKKQLHDLNKERIKKVFGESFKTDEEDIKRVFFLSSTYSISGEIFSKLVHIDWTNSKRPFPRGLDIPAVFGNKTAQDIILNEYKDDKAWPEYVTRLQELQQQFKGFNDWNHNYGFKGVQTALASYAEKDNYPDFMKTNAYNRKELSTALSSWTHIKHDLILYQEKPYAAEAGQGGGPEPPQHYSYVEPNLVFWDTSLELIEWLENLAQFESSYSNELKRIKELGENLRNVAYKQVEGREITKEEYDRLHYVGGTVEYILLGLLETDHIPERERSMALIADVYVYNGENLNVAVGHADDIYTIVPIKGEYYIARGAVFSYYEFKGKIYTDEAWRARIKNKNVPERPEWIKPLINNVEPIKGQMQYRY